MGCRSYKQNLSVGANTHQDNDQALKTCIRISIAMRRIGYADWDNHNYTVNDVGELHSVIAQVCLNVRLGFNISES